jgi:hypothetical protein
MLLFLSYLKFKIGQRPKNKNTRAIINFNRLAKLNKMMIAIFIGKKISLFLDNNDRINGEAK